MKYDEFIRRVQEGANLETSEEAAELSAIFLATLGEPLPRKDARHVASQLPGELQDKLTMTQPSETAPYSNDVIRLEEFYNRMKARLNVNFNDGVRLSKVVADVLRDALSPGEYRDMVNALPEDFQKLFGEPTLSE